MESTIPGLRVQPVTLRVPGCFCPIDEYPYRHRNTYTRGVRRIGRVGETRGRDLIHMPLVQCDTEHALGKFTGHVPAFSGLQMREAQESQYYRKSAAYTK
jgi:hypothetical protein